MPETITNTGFKVIVTGELRRGFCENCDTKAEKEFYTEGTRKRVRMKCPKCGGLGKLIVRTYSIQPPKPPSCAKPGCIWQFMKDSFFVMLLSIYHAKRVAYAQKYRNKVILERYRTGEPSPATIWQAIHANIKLKCPICRKYNKDPLLFRR